MSRAARRQKARQAEAKQKRRGGRSGPSRYTRIVALALVVVFVVGAGGWGVYSYVTSPLADRDVLTIVNGHEITVRELTRRENVIRYLYGIGEIKPDLREAILEDLVDEKLIAAEAVRRGIVVTEEDLDPLAGQFEEALRVVYGSPLAITVQRLRLRVGAADLVAYQTAFIMNRKLYESVTAEVTVTEGDIVALYEELKETLDEAGLSLEQARDRLAEEALQKKRGEVYTAFIEQLRAQAEIASPG